MYTAMCSRYLKGIPAKYHSQEKEVSSSGYDMGGGYPWLRNGRMPYEANSP
jgi:hypothetical protein